MHVCVGNVANWIVDCAEIPLFTRCDHKRHTGTSVARRVSYPLTEERVEEFVDEVLPMWQITQTKISEMLADSRSNMIIVLCDWLDRMLSKSDGEEYESGSTHPTLSPEENMHRDAKVMTIMT